ncbi:cupin domain-containing protein [Paenibacillus glycinis]|uniref:Cupin domain-containing protein n=1 Tax=Paenibacillus glycinis TaxID=2697035 RepID=A0ABW9XM99_9BACL|nr:cupin domain-containing protein [Paenibacillus glycinis]NBD23760.1 cupin domain-containing protein [Paenibacillus glycinis]
MSDNKMMQEESQVGKDFWYVGTLITVKADAVSTDNKFAMFECLVPAGFEPPYHIHKEEDEAFYVLEGEMEFFLDGKKMEGGKPGTFVYLPRNVPHGVRAVGDKPVRLLNFFNRAEFLGLFLEMAEPASRKELPPPTAWDFEKVMELSEKYNAVTLGPLNEFVK